MTSLPTTELMLTPAAAALLSALHRELYSRWESLNADLIGIEVNTEHLERTLLTPRPLRERGAAEQRGEGSSERRSRSMHGILLNPISGSPLTDFPSQSLPDYQAAQLPAELLGRRAELVVEASDLQAIRAALASGARALVLDFDDTFAPSFTNVRAAYAALPELIGAAARNGQALLLRPRALYAVEPHLTVFETGGGPASAALCDLAAVLSARPARPLPIYIPKLETVVQAQFWDDALSLIERHLGWPPDSVPVCLQIETWLGLLCADDLLYALRRRAYGLNAGRWDYVFSLVKTLGSRPDMRPLPSRAELGMDQDSMRAYAETLVRVAQRRGAQAIGGSAALSPDPVKAQVALDRVRADKRREAEQGFTAAWTGSPAVLGAVEAGFAGVQAAPLPPEARERTLERLLSLPDNCPLTLEAVQDAVGLALDVFAAWYAGRGVVVRKGSTEDTATAELARAQLWQWVRCRAELSTGEMFTPERYLEERRAQRPDAAPESRLLDELVLAESCAAYFPRAAQALAQADLLEPDLPLENRS